jgi:uncharacterized protein (DUF1015 family)
VDIFPFRGIAYNQQKAGDLSQLVTQPYDKIDESMQEAYYRRNEYNIVRIIKGREEAGDTAENNQYTRAADCFNRWLQEGILYQKDSAGIQAYHQTYMLDDGINRVRKGFVALGRLRNYDEGGIKPHENTLAGPKADRLNLMRATRANFGHVFMLYSDPGYDIEKALESHVAGPAHMTAMAESGVLHQMWSVNDDNTIDTIKQIMADKEVFIADGHHRYETALNYRVEMSARGLHSEGNESVDNRMMTFINIHDKALTILPTHRAVFGVDPGRIARMKEEVENYFSVDEFRYSEESEEEVRKEFIQAMAERGTNAHCFGLYVHNEDCYKLLILKDTSILSSFDQGGHSQAYLELDVSILHSLLLRHFPGDR